MSFHGNLKRGKGGEVPFSEMKLWNLLNLPDIVDLFDETLELHISTARENALYWNSSWVSSGLFLACATSSLSSYVLVSDDFIEKKESILGKKLMQAQWIAVMRASFKLYL